MPAPQIEVRYAPAQPSLSDLIQVEVTLANAPPDVVLSPINIAPDCVNVRRVQIAEGRTQLALELDPVKPGPCHIPAFHTQCLHSTTPACDSPSTETIIQITTLIPPGDTTPDIRDKDELPLPFAAKPAVKAHTSNPHPAWIIAACLFIAAILFLLRNRRKTPNPKSSATFDELNTILRNYLDQCLDISTATLTSPELTAALTDRALIEGRSLETLEQFLATCDRAKFAGEPLSPEQLETARTQCDQLIRFLDARIEWSSRARV